MKEPNTIAAEMGVLGRKGLIVGDHPWAGSHGEIVAVQETLVGLGVVVRMDNGHECFVFDGKLWRPDPSPVATKRRRRA